MKKLSAAHIPKIYFSNKELNYPVIYEKEEWREEIAPVVILF